MSEVRTKILKDFAAWTTLSALRRAPVRARSVVYRLLRAVDFEALFDPDKGVIGRNQFDEWHRKAKIINVYLKTRAYVGTSGRPNLSDHLHPPIDSGLWTGLRQKFGPRSDVTRLTHCVKQIKDIETQECYDRIIEGCRLAATKFGCRLIEVEQLWTGTELAGRPSP